MKFGVIDQVVIEKKSFENVDDEQMDDEGYHPISSIGLREVQNSYVCKWYVLPVICFRHRCIFGEPVLSICYTSGRHHSQYPPYSCCYLEILIVL